MIDQTKLVEVSYSNEVPTSCCSDKCKRGINILDKYFLDTFCDKIYCYQCGMCLRFSRRRALKRGEAIDSVEI